MGESGDDLVQQARVTLLALLLAFGCWPVAARAQSPTAVQKLQLSAFGGLSGAFTGLSGGKNLSIAAGVDLALPPVLHLRPTLEVRGTYPIDKGTIDSQKDILAGLRVDFLLGHRLHPYADFLAGRGEMDYGNNGFFYNNFEYQLTTTNVFSPGAGFDYDLTPHFALKVDGQVERWSGAPTTSGVVYSKVGTVGIVYYFDFNPRHAR